MENFKIIFKISKSPIEYNQAINFLEKKVGEVYQNKKKEFVWILEHPSIYTRGISSKNGDLLIPDLFPVINTNRGGQFTYHGPGQIVVYFAINLNNRGKEIKKFVRMVELWIINILKDFDIKSYADPKNIGIWVKNNNLDNKIAAIGIRVKKWIAYHGFAININVPKENYRGIVPCGIKNKGIANIADYTKIPSKFDLENSIKKNFEKLFKN